jgi:hypothetical protein
MIKKMLAAVVIIIVASCTGKDKIPNNVLPKDKMQAVLWDVLRADAFAFNFVTKDSTKKPEAELAKLQQQIFAVHKVTRESFYSSYNYYLAHPRIMLPLLDTMTNKYTKAKYESKAVKSIGEHFKDSLVAK